MKQRLGVFNDFNIPIHRVTRSLVVKTNLPSSEIAAMQFARLNTSIPLPRVFHLRDDLVFMDFIDGKMLCECWDTLSCLMRFRVACTLRRYVKEMRAHRGPRVGAVDDGYVQGHLFEENVYSPFPSPLRFRQFCELIAYEGWRTRALYHQDITGVVPALPLPDFDWTPVFIHGDLNASNILLDRHGVLWIIDWGMSGFYPASMESCAFRLVDDILRPNVRTSWSALRSFMMGHTPNAVDEFWYDFYSAIHRFPGMNTL